MAYIFDTMGDASVATPPRSAMPLAFGILVISAVAGLYLGLNAGDHRTRLPGDTRTAGAGTGADFSRARVAVAIAPEDVAPPPPPAPEPVVEAKVEQTVETVPVVRTPPPVAVEAAPAAAPVTAGPPANLEGLF